MEECSQITTMPDQESIDKVVTQISPHHHHHHQKSMDPSSVGFVYQWMFSMMASALNFNKPPNFDNEKQQIEQQINKENEKDGFIRSLGNIRLSSEPSDSSSDNFYNNNNNVDENNIINNNNNNNNSSDSIENSDDDNDDQEQINNNNKENDEIESNNNNINSKNCIKQQQQQQQNNNNNNTTTYHLNQNNFLTIPTSSTKKTLILDLDETLVHSTLKPVSHHHITVKVLIEDMDCTFYVIKRPHVDYFIEKVSQWYDVVIFTASMQQYADPLLDQLDTNKVFKKRLFRDSCLEKDGNFVKDLSMINQDLTSTIIIDNSPIAYSNNLENALPIDNWMGDNPSDTSLLSLLPFLEIIRHVQDVRSILSLRLLNSQ